jgi:hypothetical protein
LLIVFILLVLLFDRHVIRLFETFGKVRVLRLNETQHF